MSREIAKNLIKEMNKIYRQESESLMRKMVKFEATIRRTLDYNLEGKMPEEEFNLFQEQLKEDEDEVAIELIDSYGDHASPDDWDSEVELIKKEKRKVV